MVGTQKTSVAALILDKVDFKTRNITKDKEGHLMKISVCSKCRRTNMHISYLYEHMPVFLSELPIPSPFHLASEH